MIKIILTLAVASHAFAGGYRDRGEGEIELQETQITVSRCDIGSKAMIVDLDVGTKCNLVNDPADDSGGFEGPQMIVQLDEPHCIKKITNLYNSISPYAEAGFTCTKDGCKCTLERLSGSCTTHQLHVGGEDMSAYPPQDDCLWLSSFRYEKSGSSSEIEIYEFAVVEKVMETPSELQGEYQQYSSQSGLASFITI